MAHRSSFTQSGFQNLEGYEEATRRLRGVNRLFAQGFVKDLVVVQQQRNKAELQKDVSKLNNNYKNKAHKANDASSWWWNDCMMMWLQEIHLVYLLLQLFAQKYRFFLFFTKARPTDRPTDG